MLAINRQRLGTGLILILFAAIYFERRHHAGFTPADESLVGFFGIFGAYVCVRAFDSLWRRDSRKSDSPQP